ncbi:MAG: histone deacetylase [bacterium]
MVVHLVTHPDCLLHSNGPGHPERPDRLRSLLDLFDEPRWTGRLDRREAPEATREQLLRVHPADYLDGLRTAAPGGEGLVPLDPDTSMNRHSWTAASRAAGGAALAARMALEEGEPVFAAVRPPGHHAERARAMGFCLLNSVVVAAREVQESTGTERVLIVDWDVHHGNGTQDLVEEDPSIRYVSLHQYPYYPGTGAAHERGVGNIFNVPMGPGRPPEEYVRALEEAIDTAVEGWGPDLVLVSAGFDAMAGDPLAGFTLQPEHYTLLTRRLLREEVPIAGVLEGGYSLEDLAAGVDAFLEVLIS